MKIIIAITGASGAVYGIRMLEECRNNNVETHLILTKWAETTIEEETDYSVGTVKELADFFYEEDDMAAAIASGSFKCDGMIVAPCSVKTLAGIAHGLANNLVARAADVALKEKRKLVLMVRETPLNPIHLENMTKLSKLGVVIMPPVPAFYTRPESIDDIVSQTVGRALDQLGIETALLKRWGG
ncbi:MAG TPA: UbiX family flavin prenyltransferase [Desulfobacteria bacterium]|nr:UbiX family flavin prenyltransferase [Desulfobacteria bacterium]